MLLPKQGQFKVGIQEKKIFGEKLFFLKTIYCLASISIPLSSTACF